MSQRTFSIVKPDAVKKGHTGAILAEIEKAGFKIVTNAYPHNWTWHLSRIEGSPWNDIRVRKAANLAIDRAGLKVLLNGLMIPAKGFVVPDSQWFGHPKFDVKFDPEQAKKLLAEAGYGPSKPVQVKILTPAPQQPVFGQVLFEAKVAGNEAVVRVEFLIDGRSTRFRGIRQPPATFCVAVVQLKPGTPANGACTRAAPAPLR